MSSSNGRRKVRKACKKCGTEVGQEVEDVGATLYFLTGSAYIDLASSRNA
jgi:hypothetical protein